MTPSVACQPRDGGWRCSVRIGDGADATQHVVEVERAVLEDIAPGRTPEELVRESFAFLLEREPPASILRSFELPVIGRYFPEYAEHMRRRFGRLIRE